MVIAFSPYPEREVMVTEIRPRFATAGAVPSNSIRAENPAITADPCWRLLGHRLSVLNIVPEFADRSSSCPDPERESGFRPNLTGSSGGLTYRCRVGKRPSAGCEAD